MDISELISLFETNFEAMRDKFVINDILVSEAYNSTREYIWKPGVYVFWHPSRGVIRVGRSFDNARKRALQHILANTGGAMSRLDSDPDARLILFSVKNPEDRFWIAALEVLFELRTSPEVKAGRLG